MIRTLYDILEEAPGSRVGKYLSLFLAMLIALNVVVLIIGTIPDIEDYAVHRTFWLVEVVTISIFTTEYALRLAVCTVDPKYRHPVFGRLRYALTPMALIDLAAIVPFYVLLVGVSGNVDLRFLRAVRLISRLMKLGGHSSGLAKLAHVFYVKRRELATVLSVLGFLLVVASSLMYFVEHAEQPENFSSIPTTMWWGIVTLTTVGYGDLAPITPSGRILAAVIAVLGIGMFALPAGILGAGFIEGMSRKTCPHCGQPLE